MIEDHLQIDLPPGFYGNGTMYEAAGRWRTGNFVRFHEGTKRPIGGWRVLPLTGASMLGIAQASISWQAEDGTPYLAVGTTNGLYVIDANNVVYDITPGTITAAPHNWQLSNYGTYLIAVNTLLGDQDITAINTYFWDATNTATPAAEAWTTVLGPLGVYATFTTPEKYLVCLRGEDPSGFPVRGGIGTAYSEHRVYWPSQETLTDFLATPTNNAGDFDLQTKGRLMAGIGARGESIILSDIDAWKMVFLGGDLVYSFVQAGTNCGTVSKFAHVGLDQGVFWMGRGKFFLYDGFVKSIPCEVSDAVFKDFNEQRAFMVWAVANPRYNEVTWFYPSAGANSPDSYVTYNYTENHWVTGKMIRSSGVQQRFSADVIDEPVPVWFDNAQPFEHEVGTEHDALAFLESGPIQLQDGSRLMRLQGVLPDDANIGDVQLRIYTSLAPDDQEKLHGPYSLSALTSVRLTARQIRVRLEETGSADWRVGKVRLGVRAVERRGPGAGQPADNVPVSIEILPDAVTLTTSQHFTFESIIRNAAGEVLDIVPDFWTSDNAQVPVDDFGTVDALSTPEVANIQAGLVSPALLSNVAVVTVDGDDVPAKIVISPSAASVIAASTPAALTALVYNKAGQLLPLASIDTWLSDTPADATVTAGGGQNLAASAEGVALGAANITAKITTGVPTPVISNTSVITVTDPFVVHTFLSSAQFHVSTIGSGVVDRVLLVGGGASGGSVCGTGVGAGGGGAGAVIEATAVTVASGDNPVNIGGGGASVTAVNVSGLTVEDGLSGGPTSFQSHTADGGGFGGAASAGGSTDGASNPAGSGGGGRGDLGGGLGGGGGSTGGHSGGAGSSGSGGGGGGAGSVGVVGAGGSGISNDISGTAQTYGPGGSGSIVSSGGAAVAGADGADGIGAGGDGAQGGFTSVPIDEGLAAPSGKGGDGVVIIRYKVSTGIVATGGIKVVHS